ncbi:Kunitz trypsin inhibitor [Melia azedarach]|uniref:Kunitz trypsin inhibitor n=1 Tax=Melia azedarach TaxID=155640 RepID=A0ACC1XR35_MELAZ|nr:Kunitz trypsin inhibitor [Melia azedarach]
MRTALVLLSFLTFSLIDAAPAPDPVLDVYGKQLRAGTSYFILPAVRGRGGGLTLASIGYKTCPLNVVQERYQLGNGLPLTFHPVYPKKGVVRVSTDLNIKFEATSTCDQSTVWKLDSFNGTLKQWFVTIGGVLGNPGPKTTSNWFKIEKFEDEYKLVFCPTVSHFCKVQCRDIGIFIDGAVRRLALSDVPFKVVFRKQT